MKKVNFKVQTMYIDEAPLQTHSVLIDDEPKITT